jgi:4-alpha-glucanotransferase
MSAQFNLNRAHWEDERQQGLTLGGNALYNPSILMAGFFVLDKRNSGILLHITSLPSPQGIGDLGAEARQFADFLARAGQTLWQTLPTGPTGFGDSPYQCFSAFAGNPLLIDLDELVDIGLLDPADLAEPPPFPTHIDYTQVIAYKTSRLDQASKRFLQSPQHPLRAAFQTFCESHSDWLDDFALFMALKHAHEGYAWNTWSRPFMRRDPEVLRSFQNAHGERLDSHRFQQFIFFRQWHALREYCNKLGIHLIGDIPIFVAYDSADVWAHPELFKLQPDGKPEVVAGVPPDYFSATGQLWGNPLYRWDIMKQSDYAWWRRRLQIALDSNDAIRLDHYRGFFAAWEIPYGHPTAEHGQWVAGPGRAFFTSMQRYFGTLPLIAENLGHLTGEVETVREEFALPGMAILQFAFGSDAQAPSFRPHNYPKRVVAYTGTHDNDTTLGWWNSLPPTGVAASLGARPERAYAQQYFHDDSPDIHWTFIRGVIASAAQWALMPLQDVLGLDTSARMNIPAKPDGNWRWRFEPHALNTALAERLHDLVELYDRLPNDSHSP